MIIKALTPILFLLPMSCNLKIKKAVFQTDDFKFPVIIQHIELDSLEGWKTDGINEVFPKFIGQYEFSDTVYLDEERQERHINKAQDRWESRPFDFDTLSSDGLQIYTDYEETITSKFYYDEPRSHQFFPVYVVNETTVPKKFIAKDNYVFAIQEAVDTSDFNTWYAIEARGFDFCGNGYFKRRILPKEFIMFLMPKYSGNDTTFLRARIKIGDNILVSKPYKGTISQYQFKAHKDSWVYDLLKKKDAESNNWMFYGATNKE